MLLEESLDIATASGDAKGRARSLAGLGVVAMIDSRPEDAMTLTEESRALYQQLGERRGEAMANHNLASVKWSLGLGDHGRADLETALQMFREVGDQSTEALCLSALVSAMVRGGHLEEARRRLLECLALLETLEAPREAVYALDALGEWLFASDRPDPAARMLGAADVAREALGAPHLPAERVELEKLWSRITAALGDGEAARLRSEGGLLTLQQALAEAAALANEVRQA